MPYISAMNTWKHAEQIFAPGLPPLPYYQTTIPIKISRGCIANVRRSAMLRRRVGIRISLDHAFQNTGIQGAEDTAGFEAWPAFFAEAVGLKPREDNFLSKNHVVPRRAVRLRCDVKFSAADRASWQEAGLSFST